MKNNYYEVLSVILLFLLPINLYAMTYEQSGEISDCQLLSSSQLNKLSADRIDYYQLANGLKIYSMENHRLPIFSLRLVFDVGAANELPGESGYAHLFEHMMFKGSTNVPDGEHFSSIKHSGGNVNASTDYDKTVYWTEAPVDSLDKVLWLEAERLQHLAITEVNLDNQRQAVLEEKLLRIDNVPYFKVASEFMVSAWRGTEYDHLIIGNETDIKNATVKKVKRFFDHYYQPDNAILVLVGDIDTNRAIEKIEFYFSDIKSKFSSQTNQAFAKKTPNLKGKSERHFDPLAPFPLYALGWHTVGMKNTDFYAVELLADILLNHDASRFKQALKEEQELVFETIGFPLTFEQAGITAMGMVPHSYADFHQIKNVIKKELERVRLHGVSELELCSAQKYRQMKIIKKMSNNREMAELIANGALFFNDPGYAITALNAYQQVDNQQIKAVAQKYFHEDWRALTIEPGPGVRFVKWLMEILPKSLSKTLEEQFL
ncbi:MAG: insulinase family protein [gamma proteobacterium symbiont of Lucinoma myriamae]|nr:insulinase family protein [gamma proteobacterium symbiont of Lucinoma myriamae]MCU7817656.1 insulinase family protein [gamma proteobacterium symbiont of Lucinoma myriamae]MCU7832682.1 insulinase family protein [gamma proteobacterium symbiont of Lucinoma myriamae]